MNVDGVAPSIEPRIERFRSPGSVVARFIARSVSKTALIVGCAFAFYIVSSVWGYAKTYSTEAARSTLAATFGHNPGFNAIFGVARNIETVRGFAAWRTLAILTVIGAIWALAVATKRFRGEEESGHLELLLAGQTTARQAAAGTLGGLGVGLLIIYVLAAATTVIVGQTNNLHFMVSESIFYSLALVASVAEFFAIGALASQIAPTRRRAAAFAAGAFGVAFLLRAIGDASSGLHWLTYASPLGWIENLRPLTGSSPLWLLPISGFVAILCGLAAYTAGRRDLGSSLLPDKDSAEPRTRFLNTSLGLAVRDVRISVLAWLAAIAVGSIAMGAIAKSAGEAMNTSDTLRNYFGNVTQTQANVFGALAYLGFILLVLMAVLMVLAASFVGAIREDEAEGYLDNLLVRPVSRLKWLRERLIVVIVSVILSGLAAGVFAWLGAASQHTGVGFGKLLASSVNAMVPAAVIVGIGVLIIGIRPRLTSTALYVVIGWSFLLELIGPAINLNHWILDTSLLHHVALAPAAGPRWSTSGILVAIAVIACLIGAFLFNRRDLAGK